VDSIPSVRVSGVVSGLDGPVAGVVLTLTLADNRGIDSPLNLAHVVSRSDEQGRFTMLGVPPGFYELHAEFRASVGPALDPLQTTIALGLASRPGLPGGIVPGIKAISDDNPILERTIALVVNGSAIDDIPLTLQRGPSVDGLVRFVGSSPPPIAAQLSRATVTLRPVGRKVGSVLAGVRNDSRFHVPSLPAALYTISTSTFPDWNVASVELDGVDHGIQPIDVRDLPSYSVVITFTDKQTSLSGVLRNADLSPAAGVMIFVFPSDRAEWNLPGAAAMMTAIRTSEQGTFRLERLPPGTYSVKSVKTGTLESDWRDTSTLELLERGSTHVALSRGDQKTVSIQTR
jgi:hypothetical protein